MIKAFGKKRRKDQQELVWSLIFGSVFYGSLIGAVAHRMGYLEGSYFSLVASILTWVIIVFVWLALATYVWVATRFFQKHWSDDLELDEFSGKITTVLKNLSPMRMLTLALLISTLFYIGAGITAVGFLITVSIFTSTVVGSALLAKYRLHRITF